MKILIAAALLALPALAQAQEADSVVRRIIDAQLATGVTEPRGPGVPGSEAPRLLGSAAQPQQNPGPSATGMTPASGASPFAPPTGMGGR